MKKQKLYVSPSANRKAARFPNPYFINLKKGLEKDFELLEADNKPCLMQSTALLKNSFKADLFFLSFVENVAYQRLAPIQTLLALLGLDIIKLRGKPVVFFYHNPITHKGENWMSKILFRRLFSLAKYVVAHSENNASTAREKVGAENVLLFPHPCCPLELAEPAEEKDDVLIWGTVLPYKGVLEFISNPKVAASGLKIRILGRCPDKKLAASIHKYENGNIIFDERMADMDELSSRMAASRFVLFPFIIKSISGSASLMDSLRYGANVIGPDVGGFHDAAEEGICRVYRDYDELLEILNSDWKVDRDALSDFLDRYSWPAYIEALTELAQRVG